MSYSPLVLLSGGIDSSTLLATTLTVPDKPGWRNTNALAIFIDYGQRHIREHESAKAVSDYYGVELITISAPSFGATVKSSSLTNPEIPVPHGHYTAETMKQTVVPNRNATLLSIAAGVAASRGYTSVQAAMHAGDHAIYPDCRPDFIQAIDHATQLGCGVSVGAPFINLTKAQIIRVGSHLGVPVPYWLTWSCYQGGGKHCGRCGTCVERAEAFHLAGVDDPTPYDDPTYWQQATQGV